MKRRAFVKNSSFTVGSTLVLSRLLSTQGFASDSTSPATYYIVCTDGITSSEEDAQEATTSVPNPAMAPLYALWSLLDVVFDQNMTENELSGSGYMDFHASAQLSYDGPDKGAIGTAHTMKVTGTGHGWFEDDMDQCEVTGSEVTQTASLGSAASGARPGLSYSPNPNEIGPQQGGEGNTKVDIRTSLNGGLATARVEYHPVFGLNLPESLDNIPSEVEADKSGSRGFAVMTYDEYLSWCEQNDVTPNSEP